MSIINNLYISFDLDTENIVSIKGLTDTEIYQPGAIKQSKSRIRKKDIFFYKQMPYKYLGYDGHIRLKTKTYGRKKTNYHQCNRSGNVNRHGQATRSEKAVSTISCQDQGLHRENEIGEDQG